MSAKGDHGRRYRDFEFNLRELAGSMGDFGTLFPLAIGFVAVNRMDPAGLFIVMGLANIALGLIYRLPMPLEPEKVVAVTAIAHGQGGDRAARLEAGAGLDVAHHLVEAKERIGLVSDIANLYAELRLRLLMSSMGSEKTGVVGISRHEPHKEFNTCHRGS